MSSLTRTVVTALALSAITVIPSAAQTLLNASYDPTRELYQDFNAAFARYWKAKTGQTVGIKQVDDRIWLASFMDYDLGYFDDQTCRLEPLQNPFGPKVLPMSPV